MKRVSLVQRRSEVLSAVVMFFMVSMLFSDIPNCRYCSSSRCGVSVCGFAADLLICEAVSRFKQALSLSLHPHSSSEDRFRFK